MRNHEKFYKAQALAIIMVIIVVSSIIGFSIFIRSLRDKRSTIQERDSAEAYEVVDMILDNLLLSTPEEWEEKIQKKRNYINKEINTVTEDLGHGINVSLFNTCPLPAESEGDVDGVDANKYTLTLEDSDGSKPYEIRPSQAFTFVVDGEAPTNCSVSVTFQNPPAGAGFMLNKIYRASAFASGSNPNAINIKDYDYPDAETYCLGSSSTSCLNFSKEGGVTYHNPKDPLTIPMTETGKVLDRIQIIAINYPIWITYTASKECGNRFDMLVLRASATCNSVYRAKEVLVPKVRSNYSIFNYVLFNGKGELSP